MAENFRGPIRDPRIELMLVDAAIAKQELAQDWGEHQGYKRFCESILRLRGDHLEVLSTTNVDDLRFHQGVLYALKTILAPSTYDRRHVERLRTKRQGLQEEIRSLQDAALLPPDEAKP